MRLCLALSLGVASLVGGLPATVPSPSPVLDERGTSATVSLAAGSTVIGSSSRGVESFNGIPFASPPVGSLRLKPPKKLSSPLGNFDATGSAPSCPQMFFSDASGGFLTQVLGTVINTPLLQRITNAKEDCLTVSVQRPAGTSPGAKLPVLFWIFGGGFEVRLAYQGFLSRLLLD